MKKIYSLFVSKSLLLLLFLSLNAGTVVYGQCSPPTENFDNTSNGTAGFTGDFRYNMALMRLEKQNVISPGSYEVITPTYKLPNSANQIFFGFVLDGTVKVSTVDVFLIYVPTTTNEVTEAKISVITPSYDLTVSPAMATVCRSIGTTEPNGFPMGGNYRFRFVLTASSGNGLAGENITFDNFFTNGTTALAPLPVTFMGFEAKKAGSNVQLTWRVAGEENTDRYEVEKSEDSRNFTSLGTVARSGKSTYTFTDASNLRNVYYRIKTIEKDGSYKFSSVARFTNGQSVIVIKAFPQPALSNLTVQHPVVNGKAKITISTADGRVVRSATPALGTMQTQVDLMGLQAGMYMMRFDGGDGAVQTLKVMKQ